MTERMVRAILGISLCIAFITVGLGIFYQPHVGTLLLIEQIGISTNSLGWAFIISGIANGIAGLTNKALNPMFFAVFVLYTGFTWVGVTLNTGIPVHPAAFYSLLVVFYTVNFMVEVWGEQE